MFSGVCTAIVTPFIKNKIDFKSLEKLIKIQLDAKISAICPCGTTGEIATLSDEEYESLIDFVVKIVNKRAFVLAGIGGNDTAKVIKRAKICQKLGVNGLLGVAPYYNKPNQEGLIAHFTELAKNTKLPIMLYNVPGRTVTDISDETIVSLAKIKNIVALKDATGLLERVATLRCKLNDAKIKDFKIFSGDDITSLGYIAMGASGVISVASNIIPKELVKMNAFALKGEFEKARKLQDKYAIFFDSMFIDTNPAPVKYCLSKLKFITNELRLPLVKLNPEKSKTIDSLMKKLEIL